MKPIGEALIDIVTALTTKLLPASIIAPVENNATSSKAYSVGDKIMRNGKLYIIKTAISQGDTFSNSNIEEDDDITTQIKSSSPTWSNISNKPFSTIGNGLVNVANALTAHIQSVGFGKGSATPSSTITKKVGISYTTEVSTEISEFAEIMQTTIAHVANDGDAIAQFQNSAIKTTSIIDVYTDPIELPHESITTTNGNCSVNFGNIPSTLGTVNVRILIRNW